MGSTIIKAGNVERPHGIDEEDYHVFRSKVSDRHRNIGISGFPVMAKLDEPYEGFKGKEITTELEAAQDFFDQNSDFYNWAQDLNPDEISALHDLVRGDLQTKEAFGPYKDMSKDLQWDVTHLTKIMDNTLHNKPFIVYRDCNWKLLNNGSKSPLTLEQLQDMQGQLVTSTGFMSSSAAEQGLNISGSQPVELAIHIPGGKKSLGAGQFIAGRGAQGMENEREFVNNRMSVYQIGKARYDPIRMITVVDLYFMGVDKSGRFK